VSPALPQHPPFGHPAGWGYLEELGVVGAVLAGVGLRVLPAPLQLAEAACGVEVAGIQLGQVNLGEAGVEVLLAGHFVLGSGEKGGELCHAAAAGSSNACGDSRSPRAPSPRVQLSGRSQTSFGTGSGRSSYTAVESTSSPHPLQIGLHSLAVPLLVTNTHPATATKPPLVRPAPWQRWSHSICTGRASSPLASRSSKRGTVIQLPVLLGDTEAIPAFGALRARSRAVQLPWGSAITERGGTLGGTRDSNAQGQAPAGVAAACPVPTTRHGAARGQSLRGSGTSHGTAEAIRTWSPHHTRRTKTARTGGFGRRRGDASSRNRAENPLLTTASSRDLARFCPAPSRCPATEPHGCAQHPRERGPAPARLCPRCQRPPAPSPRVPLGFAPDTRVQTRRGRVLCDSSWRRPPGSSFVATREASSFTRRAGCGSGKHLSRERGCEGRRTWGPPLLKHPRTVSSDAQREGKGISNPAAAMEETEFFSFSSLFFCFNWIIWDY